MNKEEEKEEVEDIKVIDKFNWKVPKCCQEGWKSCPHVVKRQEVKRGDNIGL